MFSSSNNYDFKKYRLSSAPVNYVLLVAADAGGGNRRLPGRSDLAALRRAVQLAGLALPGRNYLALPLLPYYR